MTPDRFSGDPRLLLTPNGADLDYEGGQPIMDQGLENQALIALFTRPGWCGNLFLADASKIGSDFLDACSAPLTLSSLTDIVNAAERALASPLFGSVTVAVANPQSWDLAITITLGPGRALTLNRIGMLWSAQAANPASGRLVKRRTRCTRSLTTQEQIDQNIANIESRIGQTTPPADLAYNNVVATMEAMGQTALAKYAADRTLAVLAQTAQGADLDLLGAEYGVTRNQAVAAVLTITITGTNATVIPAGTVFIGVSNSALYTSQADGTIAVGTVTLTITAQAAGVSGNLGNGNTLSLQSTIAGATGIPTVASTVTTGADAETDDAYRPRVLSVQQSQGGGGNASDYRIWAQSVDGVVRAYPYAGPPAGSGLTSEPPMRTVYVECATSIQADGIAPGGLITQVRAAITTDPDTGLARQPLGLTDGTLYIQAITRTQMYVTVTGLSVPSGQTAQCQTAIAAALTAYFLSVSPFVTGVDPAFGRNDSITNPSVAKVVQGVLVAYGASALSVFFGTSAGVSTGFYTLGMGEKAKLGAVAYL